MKKSIPLRFLSIGEPLAQDIYDEQNRLLLKAGTHLSDQYITSLQAKGIETVLGHPGILPISMGDEGGVSMERTSMELQFYLETVGLISEEQLRNISKPKYKGVIMPREKHYLTAKIKLHPNIEQTEAHGLSRFSAKAV